MALPKENRLTTKKEIDNVFKHGRTVKGSSLFIRFLDNQGQNSYSRFAFFISSKYIPLAVDRNNLKRMFSQEIMSLSMLKRGYDVVVVIFKKADRKGFENLVEELSDLLSKV